jgi:hypothetical protein
MPLTLAAECELLSADAAAGLRAPPMPSYASLVRMDGLGAERGGGGGGSGDDAPDAEESTRAREGSMFGERGVLILQEKVERAGEEFAFSREATWTRKRERERASARSVK